MELVHKFTVFFPDVPGKTICACHDVDAGDACRPIKQHAYRVNPTKLAALRKEVQYMLHNGIVKPSQSQWSSPCVLVPKANGNYQFCTDFRRVNAVIKSDSHPLPWIDDCIDSIGHAQCVTKFDLLKGYWQVPFTTHAREISAFIMDTISCRITCLINKIFVSRAYTKVCRRCGRLFSCVRFARKQKLHLGI